MDIPSSIVIVQDKVANITPNQLSICVHCQQLFALTDVIAIETLYLPMVNQQTIRAFHQPICHEQFWSNPVLGLDRIVLPDAIRDAEQRSGRLIETYLQQSHASKIAIIQQYPECPLLLIKANTIDEVFAIVAESKTETESVIAPGLDCLTSMTLIMPLETSKILPVKGNCMLYRHFCGVFKHVLILEIVIPPNKSDELIQKALKDAFETVFKEQGLHQWLNACAWKYITINEQGHSICTIIIFLSIDEFKINSYFHRACDMFWIPSAISYEALTWSEFTPLSSITEQKDIPMEKGPKDRFTSISKETWWLIRRTTKEVFTTAQQQIITQVGSIIGEGVVVVDSFGVNETEDVMDILPIYGVATMPLFVYRLNAQKVYKDKDKTYYFIPHDLSDTEHNTPRAFKQHTIPTTRTFDLPVIYKDYDVLKDTLIQQQFQPVTLNNIHFLFLHVTDRSL